MLLYVWDYMSNLAYSTWYLLNNHAGIASVGIASVNHVCWHARSLFFTELTFGMVYPLMLWISRRLLDFGVPLMYFIFLNTGTWSSPSVFWGRGRCKCFLLILLHGLQCHGVVFNYIWAPFLLLLAPISAISRHKLVSDKTEISTTLLVHVAWGGLCTA